MKGLQAILNSVEAKYIKVKPIAFKSGDSVKVHMKVKEGDKERIQIYEGVVIAREKDGTRESFRVRRISYGVGVERSFPFQSPSIVKIEVIKRGVAFKSKLFHIRGKSAKNARIEEMRMVDATGKDAASTEVVAETLEQKVAREAAQAAKAARIAEHAAKGKGKAPAKPKAEKKPEVKVEAPKAEAKPEEKKEEPVKA